MWGTPRKTPATTASLIQVSDTPDSKTTETEQNTIIVKETIQFPNLISQNPQYFKLYSKIQKMQKKAYRSIVHQQQKNAVNNIKNTISFHLNQQHQKDQFEKKFVRAVQSARKRVDYQSSNMFGMTRQKQNNEILHNFLMDHRNAVELEQQARLTEYYLRDQQKKKSKIDYLNRVQLTNRHRRTAPQMRNRSLMLFQGDKQKQYQQAKKVTYVHNDKLISEAIQSAKMNPTYLRSKNFSQIQYILNKDNQNLMMTRQISKEENKQSNYNDTRRIFLRLAYVSQSLRTYYDYIREKDFQKVYQILLEDTRNNQIINKQYITELVNRVLKYKFNKVIHFEDFDQILKTIFEQKNYCILEHLKQNSFNQNIIQMQNIDNFIQLNLQKIKQLKKLYKIDILWKNIYQKNRNKIVGMYHISIRDLTQIMKDIGIIPKKIVMSRFMLICYWYEKRREGFTVKQFLAVQIALGLDIDCTLAGLQNYFRMFNVQNILKSH